MNSSRSQTLPLIFNRFQKICVVKLKFIHLLYIVAPREGIDSKHHRLAWLRSIKHPFFFLNLQYIAEQKLVHLDLYIKYRRAMGCTKIFKK